MSKPNFIPYPFYWDDVPVDLSFIYEDEKPAGKHGFLKVDGDRFIFEDGTEARFWGTNFNSGLNFPAYDFSEKIAKRLAKIGINIVRFHQMDSEWATPNIFQFTKGKRQGNTLEFDPESMKRLDYLIHCLKQEGIYIYMDLLTYRKFKSGDGVENAIGLADAAKPYSIFSRKLIELQKKFNEDLWNHMNPHTGLAYKDDPAIVFVEITNECDIFLKSRPVAVEPYKSELTKMYYSWCKDKGIEPVNGDVDFSDRSETMLEFLMSIQERYYTEMTDHMHKIGVKIPITGTNWHINGANRKTQLVTDFSDGHTYWYAWIWKENEKKFDNSPMVSKTETLFHWLSFCRRCDRPMFVSEWDDPWPNEWRAESSLYMAAVGLFQDWAGFAIHTYSYSTMTNIEVTGKEVSSESIGGVPYREGVFNTWNDPAKFGLFYHAALMYRRRDVKPAEKKVDIRIDDLSVSYTEIPDLSLICEKHKAGIVFNQDSSSADEIMTVGQEKVDKSGEVISDTGELYRSWEKKIGWIDTERTKVVYGFIGDNYKINLKDITFDAKTRFATIAISSLTDNPINSSDNMLLTAVGRSENTDMKFNEEHNEMLDVGKPPILVEAIQAKISIKTKISNLRVWAVNPEGLFAGVLPSEYREGVFSFNIGECYKSMYYLIQAE
jgi:hypothetical protein